MRDIDRLKARVRAANDQDLENCRKWFREATDKDKLLVWMEIQKPHDDPVAEIVSRLAQLKFGEMMAD